MATSRCIKCESTSFELSLFEPRGSAFKLYAVQCSMCGGVVGVQPYHHTNALLEKQNAAIKAIAQKVGAYVQL